MRRVLLIVSGIGLASASLAGCQTARDPACVGRNAVAVIPSAAVYAAMSGPERRGAEAWLNGEARRCGWEP